MAIFSAATSNSVLQAVGVPFPPIPNFVVTVTTDTTTGVASNCAGSPTPNCSLRDALAAAFAAGSGNITFSPTVFATAQTITLVNGSLSIPSHTTITGPTTGSGATLTNLVTVSGGGPVFTVKCHECSDIGVDDHRRFFGGRGGGILNNGVLTVTNSTISGNSANGYMDHGGGIENLGFLTLINSTVTGNSVATDAIECAVAAGGGIDNRGTLTMTNSSVTGQHCFPVRHTAAQSTIRVRSRHQQLRHADDDQQHRGRK